MEILCNTFKLLQFLQHLTNAYAYLWYYEPWNQSASQPVVEPLSTNDSPPEGTDHRCPKIKLTIIRIQLMYLESLICELITLEFTTLDFPVIKPVTLHW